MSNLYYRSGKYQSAVQYVLQASELLNHDSAWHEVLAVSVQLSNLGEEEAALRCLDYVEIGLDRNILGAFELGQQYKLLGQHKLALEWLSLAKVHEISLAQASELMGVIHMFEGDFAKSAKELQTSIYHHKNPSLALEWMLSVMGSPVDADERLARLRKLHSVNQLESDDLIYLNYALFKEHDRAGHFDMAWEHLAMASTLMRKNVFYSSELENTLYRDLMAVMLEMECPKDSISSSQQTPIFIVGMPRTGTSLLESALATHENVVACGELKLMRNQIQFVLNKRMDIPFDRNILKNLPDIDYLKLGQRYLEKAAFRTGAKPFFIDKNPGNFNYVGLIIKAMPNAKIINMVRHPMDACFSNLKEKFGNYYYTYSYTQEECANHYKNYQRLMSHWHQIAPGKTLDVAYENLVSQPGIELKKVQEFCGLECRPYQEKSRNVEFMSNSASTVQIREPIHTRNLNGWHRYRKHLKVLEEQLQTECEHYEKTYLA